MALKKYSRLAIIGLFLGTASASFSANSNGVVRIELQKHFIPH